MIVTDEEKIAAKIKADRILGHLKSKEEGPTLVFFGGVHGNEPAGVLALQQVLAQLKDSDQCYTGEVYAIAGNLGALLQNQRYQDEDLNRIWLPGRLEDIRNGARPASADAAEMRQLYSLVHGILENSRPPFYFFDIHTTSGKSTPFIVVNDSLLNRRFTSHYPLPVILGIEEYLHGAMLSFINELGYVSFGFEAGQHNDPASVLVAKDFILYSMALAGFFPDSGPNRARLKQKLARFALRSARFFEIYYQYDIQSGETFSMEPGFKNFQVVPKGTPLARSNGNVVIAQKKRRIFMPLYQKKGSEGYYFIKKTPRLFMALSSYLRRLKADELLVALPGVTWASPKKEGLLVDLRIARFFAKSVFHLLGYRARQKDDTHLWLRGREKASKTRDYEGAPWIR